MSRTISLTQSEVKTFASCQHKWRLRYKLGIRRSGSGRATGIGTALHDSIDKHYKDRSAPLVEPTVAHTGENITFDQVSAMILFQCYVNHWKDDGWETLYSEVPFSVELGDGVTVMGKIDRIVKIGDKTVLVDTKTTSYELEAGSNQYLAAMLDIQESVYTYAARKCGVAIDYSIRDMIRKPALKPKQVTETDNDGLKIILNKDGTRAKTLKGEWRQTADSAQGQFPKQREEKPEEFALRLLQDVQADPSKYFQRVPLYRTQDDIDRAISEVFTYANMMREHGFTPRNTAACLMYGGCEYLRCCHTAEVILPEGFEIVKDMHPELKETE
jgi:hypothetical protein